MNLDILKFKLQQVLQNNTAKRRKLATSWRIEPSRLAHYKTSKNLYSQPIPNTGKKYKCDIILDVSGSMHVDANWNEDRIWPAIKSAQNLVKLFHWIIDFRILTFGNWYRQMSTNELLSITPKKIKSWNWFKQALSRPMWIINTQEGKKNLVPMEGGTYNLHYWTWWPWVIGHSLQCLSWTEGERFIIFITDWTDAMQELWVNTSNLSRLPEIVDEIGGVDVRKYCPANYPAILDELEAEWINILPIGIKTSLSNTFNNSVEIDDAWEIYEKTISFIETHFNK